MGRIKSIYKSPLFILYWIVASELIGFGMIIPVLPQIVTRFHVGGVKIGLLLACYSLVQFFASPILGSLSDTYGRKPILIFSKLGSLVGYIVLAFSATYWMLMLSRFIDGLSGGNISVARAYAVDMTGTDDRSKGMAVVGIGFATGFIVGPAIGGFLYGNHSGFLYPGLVAAALSGLSALLTLVFLPESRTRLTTDSPLSRLIELPQFFSSRIVAVLLSLQLAYMVMFSGFETSISVFMNRFFGFNEQHTAWTFLYLGLLALVFQGYFSRKKIMNFPVMISIGFALGMISFAGIGSANGVTGLMVSLAVLSIAICLINVFLPSYFSSQVEASRRGLAMGIFEAIGSISRVLGPVLVYFLLFNHLRFTYYAFASVFAIVLIVFLTLVGKTVSKNERN